MRLLITDLDNTLYDWVTYFANAFRAMVTELAVVLSVSEERLLDEFRTVHQLYGNSEQPFAIFELPSVQERFESLSRTELLEVLQSPLNAFRSARKEHLHLYPSVHSTLRFLRQKNVALVAHTEATAEQAYYRLRTLGIVRHFRHIYALEGRLGPHPDPLRAADLQPPAGLISIIPKHERKPNPDLLRDICSRERVLPADAWYVGDSKTRDVAMAKNAGVTAVWAEYGTKYDRKLWEVVVRVTHWSSEDVQKEARLQTVCQNVEPDYTIRCFAEILSVSGISSTKSQSRPAIVAADS